MRLLFVFLPIIIWSLPVNAQFPKEQNSLDNIRMSVLKNSTPQSSVSPGSGPSRQHETLISGSPYLSPQFKSALIVKTDGTELNDIPVRYNVFKNTVEFEQNGFTLEIADPHAISRIICDNQILVYALYSAEKKIKSSYFQLLAEGKFQLLKMHKIVLEDMKDKQNVIISGYLKQLKTLAPDYYLRFREGTAYRIDSQQKLIRIIQPVPDEVTNHIQTSHINLRNEKELIDLVNYLNKATD